MKIVLDMDLVGSSHSHTISTLWEFVTYKLVLVVVLCILNRTKLPCR